MFRSLAAASIKNPKRTLVVWAMIVAVLGYVGLGLSSKVQGGNLVIKGSDSAKAVSLEQESFDSGERIAIVLEGSDAALKKFGPQAVVAINEIEHVSANNPWSESAPKGMLKPNNGLVMAEVDGSLDYAGDVVAPKLRSRLAEVLPPSIKVHMIGASLFSWEMRKATLDGAKRAEIAAAPVLILVLLLIFRSVIAAALPLLMGICVTAVGKGLMAVAAGVMEVNTIAVSVISVVGLALGVDYSLMLVSRFREEMKLHPDDPLAATTKALNTAGQTVIMAGVIVAIGLTMIAMMLPGAILVGISASVAVAALLSVFAAITLLPAILMMLGSGVDRWSWGQAGTGDKRYQLLVKKVIRRPALATTLALVPLLLLSLPAFGLKTGPPDPRQLPDSNRLVQDSNYFEQQFGKGWMGPFVIVAKNDNGPITDARTLRVLADAQRQIAKRKDVAMVLGPAPFAEPAKRLKSSTTKGPKQLASLSKGLKQANDGVSKLRLGLAQASSGAGILSSGSSQSLAGSQALQAGILQASESLQQLDAGLGEIRSGSGRLTSGISSLKAGTKDLKAASKKAAAGAESLAAPAKEFQTQLESAKTQIAKLPALSDQAITSLQSAKSALDSASDATKADPQYSSAYAEIESALTTLSGSGSLQLDSFDALSSGIASTSQLADAAAAQAELLAEGADQLASGLDEISAATAKIDAGTGSSASGSKSLNSAISKAENGSSQLSDGAGVLSSGAGSLTGGLSQLSSGANSLAGGLNSGSARSKSLSKGVGKLNSKVGSANRKLRSAGGDKDASAQERAAAQRRIANSGYLTLAALAGGTAEERREADAVVNASNGGDSARLIVVPKDFAIDSSDLSKDLDGQASQIGKKLDDTVVVGGGGAVISTYKQLTNDKRVPVVVVMSLVTLLFLMVVFRSVLLAFKAVALNLVVVGVVFGLLSLLTQGADPILGGPGFLESNVFFMIYGVVFTLSMDYEIFMINRMREGYELTGSNDQAIDYGISKSASVVTGAAAIMTGVFMAFALFGEASVRVVGIGLTIAVLIDATLVRLVLLPATMRMFGRANWWIPGWLDRLLPKVNFSDH